MGILGADGAMLREPTYDHILQFGKEGSARTNQGGWLGKNGSVQGGQWGYLKADGTELVFAIFCGDIERRAGLTKAQREACFQLILLRFCFQDYV